MFFGYNKIIKVVERETLLIIVYTIGVLVCNTGMRNMFMCNTAVCNVQEGTLSC